MTIPSVLWLKSEGGGCECDEGLNGNETPGFNLDSDCLRAQSPGAGVDWESCCIRTIGVCVCVCFCTWTQVCVCIQCIYDGMLPRGKQCHMKVTLEWKRRGERPPASWRWRNEGDSHPPVWEHSHSRRPSAHPLWDFSSPGNPVTLAVVHLTRPPVHCPYSQLKLPQLTSDQGPF